MTGYHQVGEENTKNSSIFQHTPGLSKLRYNRTVRDHSYPADFRCWPCQGSGGGAGARARLNNLFLKLELFDGGFFSPPMSSRELRGFRVPPLPPVRDLRCSSSGLDLRDDRRSLEASPSLMFIPSTPASTPLGRLERVLPPGLLLLDRCFL